VALQPASRHTAVLRQYTLMVPVVLGHPLSLLLQVELVEAEELLLLALLPESVVELQQLQMLLDLLVVCHGAPVEHRVLASNQVL